MISHWISSALETTGVQAEVLGTADTQRTVARLNERLGVDVTRPAAWDDEAAPDGRFRTDGWELIPSYVGTAGCLLFGAGAQMIWRFTSGPDLLQVLRECPALEFYVCDPEADYLLCSNHHDVVIGWGAASGWVDNLSNLNL